MPYGQAEQVKYLGKIESFPFNVTTQDFRLSQCKGPCTFCTGVPRVLTLALNLRPQFQGPEQKKPKIRKENVWFSPQTGWTSSRPYCVMTTTTERSVTACEKFACNLFSLPLSLIVVENQNRFRIVKARLNALMIKCAFHQWGERVERKGGKNTC